MTVMESGVVSRIHAELGLIAKFEDVAQVFQHYSKLLVLSDENVWKHQGDQLASGLQKLSTPFYTYILPPGEAFKSLESVSQCWQFMSDRGFDRSSCVVGFGGGVICDIAGYTAACYMRGIGNILIPTSLLAMVDAAIGGKTAVNFAGRKNFIGAFHPPKDVVIDPLFCDTLPEREVRCGVAEMIKYAIIADSDLFNAFEAEHESDVPFDLIWHCAKGKEQITTFDPYDTGHRALLNLGHTFAHGIEEATDYRQYTHGEAVAIGLSCAAHLSYELNFCDYETVLRIDRVLRRWDLDTKLPKIPNTDLIARMRKDKKASSGDITCILICEVGDVMRQNHIDENAIDRALSAKRAHDAGMSGIKGP